MGDVRDTLRLALERHGAPGGSWLFLAATVLPALSAEWREALDAVQSMRGPFLDLRTAGYRTHSSVDEARAAGPFAGAAILAGRSRALNEWHIATALQAIPEGAPLIVAGTKTDGIASMRKRFGPVEASFAKHHATAFTIRRGAGPIDVPASQNTVEGFVIPVGTFSADGPDPASRLLVDTLPDADLGHIADFGSGWGYLAAGIGGPVAHHEADARALDAARVNHPEGTFRWIDLVREPVADRFDTIVMNPPFHTGRAADPALGLSFIARAAEALRPGGRLLMVANRQLPYEATLLERFKRVEKRRDERGFKVFEAFR